MLSVYQHFYFSGFLRNMYITDSMHSSFLLCFSQCNKKYPENFPGVVLIEYKKNEKAPTLFTSGKIEFSKSRSDDCDAKFFF